MGDRFFQPRHGNIALLLQRPASIALLPGSLLPGPLLPGMGHNGGPPLDSRTLDHSGQAWLWRRAVATAWAPPPREIALRRLERAERLGLSYRDFTAALMDTGSSLSTALLPLHHLADIERRHDGSLVIRADEAVVALVRRYEGRLLPVIDAAISGAPDLRIRRRLAALLAQRFGIAVDLPLILPVETDARRAAHLRRRLKARGILRRECFWLGRSDAEMQLAERAGLGFFKPLAGWFAAG